MIKIKILFFEQFKLMNKIFSIIIHIFTFHLYKYTYKIRMY